MWTFALLLLAQVLELEPARQHQLDLRKYLAALLVAEVEVNHGATLDV